MLDASRNELGRNSDKAGLRRCNGKDAAMPELIGSSDNTWVVGIKEDIEMLESCTSFRLAPLCNWLVRDRSLRSFLARQPDSMSLKPSKALGIVGGSQWHC
jgi:hypothetical protein